MNELSSRRSGLLGLSGISSDMRMLLASDEPAARFAVEHFVYRVGREIGPLAGALQVLDTLVFTAGIGENSAGIRAAIGAQVAWLGLDLDASANAGGAVRLSSPRSRIAAWVIPTDEESVMARHAEALLAPA